MTHRRIKMICLILVVLGLSAAHGDAHTLRFYYSEFSESGSGLPEYMVTGYIDDKKLHYHIHFHFHFHFLVPWRTYEEPEYWYWDRPSCRAIYYQPEFRNMVRVGMKLFNQTKGFHAAQWMYGCELRENGSKSGFSKIGYDGRDIIYLDKERGIYIAAISEAQLTTQEWNRPDLRMGKRTKDYLENECIDHLKEQIEYEREALERRVHPGVKVWGCSLPDGVMRLQCLVYGFYPRPVDVKWMRNGVDQVPSDEMTPILLHPDGTYQIRVSVEVPTKEGDSYSCHVDHSSLEELLIVKWGDKWTQSQNNTVTSSIAPCVTPGTKNKNTDPDDPNNGFPVAVVATVVTISILVVLGAIGVWFYCFPLIRKWAAKENSFPLIRKWAAKENSGSDDNFDASSYQSAPVSESP